jgi:hypothetical protein
LTCREFNAIGILDITAHTTHGALKVDVIMPIMGPHNCSGRVPCLAEPATVGRALCGAHREAWADKVPALRDERGGMSMKGRITKTVRRISKKLRGNYRGHSKGLKR